MVKLINNINYRICKNPQRYPGKHMNPNERSNPSVKPLETKSQLLVIYHATFSYIKEQMSKYIGVNIKNFGTFTYEVKQTLPKLGINYKKANTKTFEELLLEKKSLHKLRPCFIVDPKIASILTRFNNKEELTKPASQSSIYQKGFKMTYCNPIPIAAACSVDRGVVEDGLRAIFTAVYDLISIGQNILLKTGFCNIRFFDRNLKYSFSPEIYEMIKDLPSTEKKLIRGTTPMNKVWTTSTLTKWKNSCLSGLLEKPDSSFVKTVDNKSQMLKIMSLDLNSTYSGGFFKPKSRYLKTEY